MNSTPKKRKVIVVITARPSYSRIKTLLISLKDHQNIELKLIVTASAALNQYGGTKHLIEGEGFTVDYTIHTQLDPSSRVSAAKTTGLGIIELSTIFSIEMPDIVVTIADRYETLATAVAASYMNITLVHIQGGEVTGNIDEKVRHAITKLADYHMVATKNAYKRVLKLGELKERIFYTGCPSIDIANSISVNDKFPDFIYDKGLKIISENQRNPSSYRFNRYIIVLQHPVTTENENVQKQILETIYAIDSININTFWFWPNVDFGTDLVSKSIRVAREEGKLKNVHFLRNIPPRDFLILLKNSICIIGNSSVAIREAAFLGVHAINIGSRQSGREKSKYVFDVGYDRDEIFHAFTKIKNSRKIPKIKLYGDGNSGKRIADIIAKVELVFEKKLSY